MERAHRITMVFSTLALLSACGGPPPTDGLAPGEIGHSSAALFERNKCIKAEMFTHIARAGNIGGANGYSTAIDHPSTNSNPKAKLIVTPNWTPNGGAEVRDYHPIGVWYDSAIARWSVYHADGAPMPDGTGFNVRVGSGFAVRSPAATEPYSAFRIGYSISAPEKYFVTATYNPFGLPVGNNNWSPLAVVSHFALIWSLTHSDGLPFDPGTNYFVADERCASVLTTTADSMVGDDYVLDAARANGNPDAIVIAMRRITFDPGFPAPRQPGHLVVRYDGSRARWLVHGWNNDGEEMPVGTTMNVAVQTPGR